MPIQWRPAMAIDDGVIDDDHRYLIKLVNDAEELVGDSSGSGELIKVLYSLKYYTVFHFTREEGAQKAVNYPAHQQHVSEHKLLMLAVDQAIEMIEQEASPAQQEQLKDKVAQLLNNWLVQHIIKHDMPMRPYVKRMKQHMAGFLPMKSR